MHRTLKAAIPHPNPVEDATPRRPHTWAWLDPDATNPPQLPYRPIYVAAPAVAAGETARPRKAISAAVVAIGAGADWIDQNRSPLGKRRHMALCRAGTFKSARKEGKRWLVRRAELDAYVMREGKAPKATSTDAVDRELAAFDDVIERRR